jgi:uncharacterized surface protein with fasciclin (FAS1) repeats
MLFNSLSKIVATISAFTILSGFAFAPNVNAATGDIVDVASNASQFSTLVTALKSAELVTTLQGAGPFTVFAPTNDAFAKVPADTLAKLLLPENKNALTKVLTYHVVAGKVDAAQVVKLTTAKTVQGSNVKVAVVDNKVKLNDSTNVIATDIQATNGIVHSIDSVLIPSDVDLSKLASAKAVGGGSATTSPTVRTGGLSIVSIVQSLIALVILAFTVRSSLKQGDI